MSNEEQKSGRPASLKFTGPIAAAGNFVLGLFGSQKSGQEQYDRDMAAKAKSQQWQTEPPKIRPQAMSLDTILTLGARLPFAAFVCIVGAFTYVYHICPFVPWALVLLSLDVALLGCWPPRQIGLRERGLWDWGPMISWFVAIGAALVCGLANFGIIESWINIAFLEEYKGITVDTQAAAVSDAGVLSFSQGAYLDTSMAAGYKYWFYNYCAAPVVDEDPSAHPIVFWAIGMDCCNSRGEFTCDSATDKSAKKATVVRPFTMPQEVVDHYDRAIKMAASVNDVEAAHEHVFVRWHKDPHSVGDFAWWTATFVFWLSITVSLVACMGCQYGFSEIHRLQETPS